MFFKIDNCDKKINSDLPILRLGKVNQLMRSDIYESDNEYIINIDVPGFSKEDIKIRERIIAITFFINSSEK